MNARRKFLGTAGALALAGTVPIIVRAQAPAPGKAAASGQKGREHGMLIVDAQIHIWTGHKPANPNHRQILDFTAADVLKEMDDAGVNAAVIHPPGWDPNSNALAVEAARQHPNRFAILANFPLDKPDSKTGIDRIKGQPGVRGLRFALNQPHQKTWLTDGSLDWLWPAAERAGMPVALIGENLLQAVPKIAQCQPRTQADHRSLRSPRQDVVAPAGAARDGEISQRRAEGHRRSELLERALSVPRHTRAHPQALRRLRARAHVLGHRHHAHADFVAAVRDDVHRRAAVVEREGQGAHHGAGALQLDRVEAGGLTAVTGDQRSMTRDEGRVAPDPCPLTPDEH